MMGKMIGSAALGALLLAAVTHAPTTTAQNVPAPPPGAGREGISVLGEGVVLAQPNTARVTLGVEVSNPSLSAAQAEASRRMDAVVQTLKAAGIPDANIR